MALLLAMLFKTLLITECLETTLASEIRNLYSEYRSCVDRTFVVGFASRCTRITCSWRCFLDMNIVIQCGHLSLAKDRAFLILSFSVFLFMGSPVVTTFSPCRKDFAALLARTRMQGVVVSYLPMSQQCSSCAEVSFALWTSKIAHRIPLRRICCCSILRSQAHSDRMSCQYVQHRVYPRANQQASNQISFAIGFEPLA